MKETIRLQPLDIPVYMAFTKSDIEKLRHQLDAEIEIGDDPAFAMAIADGKQTHFIVFIDSDHPFNNHGGKDKLRSVCIHEATHIMQFYTRNIDEETRMLEFEACFMQYIIKSIWDAMVASHQFPALGRSKKC